MKFRVEREVLAEAVTWVARTLPARPAIPVLAGLLIEAEAPGLLTLSSFDYEVSARISVEAEVEQAGSGLVLGRLLADISRNLPNQPVQVEADGAKVSLTCGSSHFSLLQMPRDDYPTLPTSPDGSGQVDGSTFTEAVTQVAVAADRGDNLPILTGVRVEITGEHMTLLATDRYRLAMRELTWTPVQPELQHVALIPARTLTDTARALGAVGEVTLAFGDSAGGDGLVGLTARSRHTTTRVLDGEYPKVSKIFPTKSDTEAVMSTAELTEAVKRVAIVAERTTPVRLRFSDSTLVIEAGSGEEAQASEALDTSLTGPDIEIAFNPSYLLDGLGVVGTEFTRLSFTGPLKPAMMTGQAAPDADLDPRYRYVLQPVRLSS